MDIENKFNNARSEEEEEERTECYVPRITRKIAIISFLYHT